MKNISIIVIVTIISTILTTHDSEAKELSSLPLCHTKREVRRELRIIKRNMKRICSIAETKKSNVVHLNNTKKEENSMQKKQELMQKIDENTDVSTTSRMMLLGIDTPIAASMNIMSEQEPIMLKKITIRVSGHAASVDAFSIFTENRLFLGRATRTISTSLYSDFTLNITHEIHIPKRESMNIYARVHTKSGENGGVSGEIVQVAQVLLEAIGEWSSETIIKQADDITSPVLIAKRAIIEIKNRTPLGKKLEIGNGKTLLYLSVQTRTDNRKKATIDRIIWSMSRNNLTIDTVTIRQKGSDDRMPCTISDDVLTCEGNPLFTLEEGIQFLELQANITKAGDHPWISLDASCGNRTEDGTILWSDGISQGMWVPNEECNTGVMLRE